jgi:hypothetical protein
VKVKYIQLRQNLNLPGQPAQMKKISATGTDTSQNGCAKSITSAPGGYLVHLPAGAHAGFYFVPNEMIDHVRVDLDASELAALYPPPPAPVEAPATEPKPRTKKQAAPTEQTKPAPTTA